MAMSNPLAAVPTVFTVPAKAPVGFQVQPAKLQVLTRCACDALPVQCPGWADSKHPTQFLLDGKVIGRMQRAKIVDVISALTGIPVAAINTAAADAVPDTGQALATLKRVVRLLAFTIARNTPPPGMPAEVIVLAAPPAQQLAPLEAELVAAKAVQVHLAAALVALPGSTDLQAKAAEQAAVVAAAAAAVEDTRQRITDAAAAATTNANTTTAATAAAAANAAAGSAATAASSQQQAETAAAALNAANTALAAMQRALELIPGSAEVQAEVSRLQAVASAADAHARALGLAASINDQDVQLLGPGTGVAASDAAGQTTTLETTGSSASNAAGQTQTPHADRTGETVPARAAILRQHGVGPAVDRLAGALQDHYDVVDAGLKPADQMSPTLEKVERGCHAVDAAVRDANRALRAAGCSPCLLPPSVTEAEHALDQARSSGGRRTDPDHGCLQHGASQANAGQGLELSSHRHGGGYVGTSPGGNINYGAGHPGISAPYGHPGISAPYGAAQVAGHYHPSVFGQPPAPHGAAQAAGHHQGYATAFGQPLALQRPAIPVHGPAHSGIGSSRLAAADQATIHKGEYLDYAAAAHRMFHAGTPPKPAMRLVNDGSGTATHEAVDPDQQFAAISDTVHHQIHRAEMTFRTATEPDRGPEHDEYTRHLDDLKIRFTDSLPAGWRACDKLFRQHAAGTQQRHEVVTTTSGITAQVPMRVNWGIVDDRVHRNVFFGYKPGLCGLCGGNHFVEDHARLAKPAAKKRKPERTQSAAQAGEVCKAYNRETARSTEKGCTFKDCRFKHVCRKCGGNHASPDCTAKKPK